MTKTTTNLLLMLIAILGGTYFYVTYCSNCGKVVEKESVKEEVIAPVLPEATSYPFALSDGDFAIKENDNYNFSVSSSSILTPLSPSLMSAVDSLKGFLTKNGNKVLDITGYFKEDENNTSAYPNLGLARANAVKNHLVDNGISSEQINTMGKLMSSMVPQDDTYLGPIAYTISEKADDADETLKALYEKIKANPLVLYFDSAETSINLNAEQRQKVADISRYLDKVADAKTIIIGHTDNTGNAASNMRIGQSRADFAKDYFMRNGISASKIEATSKGQTDPIDSNSTEEGKAKNRRTVVTLN